jgi:hypothetical protein
MTEAELRIIAFLMTSGATRPAQLHAGPGSRSVELRQPDAILPGPAKRRARRAAAVGQLERKLSAPIRVVMR